MGEKKISIIVPVYNVEKYLPRCIDSILRQTYTNFECILIDDGSPDRCGRICDEYAERDKRIVVIHQKNKGVSAARNAGLDVAKGEYVGFVDSDDYIEPDLYDRLMCAIGNTQVAICGVQVEDEEGNLLRCETLCNGVLDSSSRQIEALIKTSLLGYAWNKLYRRDVISQTRFEAINNREDAIFNLRVLDGISITSLCEFLGYHYVFRQISASNSQSANNIYDLSAVAAHLFASYQRASTQAMKNAAQYVLKTLCVDIIIRDIIDNSLVPEKEKRGLIKKIVTEKSVRSLYSVELTDPWIYQLIGIGIKAKGAVLLWMMLTLIDRIH